jgi:peptide-methionine (S)-S-oxide reductase
MKATFLGFLLISISLLSCAQKKAKQTNKKTEIIKQTKMPELEKNMEVITLGAGCFWCVEAVFQGLNGVQKVVSGYSGGHVENPTYEQICNKNTGHAEVCQLYYDTTKITLPEILEVYWQTHDPTTIDQQGADRGPQYRSVIFYHNEKQKQISETYKVALDSSGAYNNTIVTAIEAFSNFYKAEDYHQNYYKNNPEQGYCRFVIQPKIEKFIKVFKDKVKKD